MKYVNLLVALLAACMLVIPAFSMPNDNQMKDGKAQIGAPCQSQVAGDRPGVQQLCDCIKERTAPMMGPANDKCNPKSMMDGKMPCQKAIGEQNGKEGTAPMMGPANDKCVPKSMMDGKIPCQKAIGEQNGKEGPAPMMGAANDKCAPKSMMDGKIPCQKAIGEQNGKEGTAAMMGPANDKCVPKSMMDGKEQNRDRQCQEQ